MKRPIFKLDFWLETLFSEWSESRRPAQLGLRPLGWGLCTVLILFIFALPIVEAKTHSRHSKVHKNHSRRVSKKDEGRSKKLDFEDEIVEGMNRNPFDSMTSVRTKEMKQTSRLYRVKGDFRSEIKLTVEEAGFVQ